MEYQVIKENGEIKFVVLPVDYFNALMEKLEDESDLKAIQASDQRATLCSGGSRRLYLHESGQKRASG